MTFASPVESFELIDRLKLSSNPTWIQYPKRTKQFAEVSYSVSLSQQSHKLKAINADLEATDKQINSLIQQDVRLNELFEWITSVPGVGNATATEVIVAIDVFKAIHELKKLACHAGVAPFAYRSGSSV